MSAELLKALDRVEANQTEIKDRLLMVEQKGSAALGELTTKTASLGDQFLKSFEANRELFEKTRSVRLEIKAAGDAITTSSGRTNANGGAAGAAHRRAALVGNGPSLARTEL